MNAAVLSGVLATVAVLLLAAVLLVLRSRAAERSARIQLRRTLDARDAELAHLVAARLPAIRERVSAGRGLDGVPGALRAPAETGEDFAAAVGALVAALGSDEGVRRERVLRDSVQAAFESVARTMHAMATVQQQVLDQVERAIDNNPALMANVMKADHAAAQMTRKAQTLLVMCGVWPARRETQPVSLYDCVRGAMSRIVEFPRVEVHGGQTLYAVPPAVEGLMHALAELLENATVFSPSPSTVIVSVREVGAGAVIEIDDAGLGMPPDVLARATAQLRDDVDLARLGAVPRLGLACVGRWMRELGFDVQLSGASAYGGTRAVAFIPFRLLTEPLAQVQGGGRTGVAQVSVPHQRTGDGLPAPSDAEGTEAAAGLPRRRSRRTPVAPPVAAQPAPVPTPAPTPAVAPEPPAPAWTPEAAQASIASVLSGSRRGRTAVDENDLAGEGPAAGPLQPTDPAPTPRTPHAPAPIAPTATTHTPDGGQP
ncbi:ATP-binding protein [Streptomyces sp. NPDC050418]|uniref:ATP-binding protein n=1 Tax=Streptomyces sp. NPDC050418 TaxID=3365612 RepID=UPI00378BBAFC